MFVEHGKYFTSCKKIGEKTNTAEANVDLNFSLWPFIALQKYFVKMKVLSIACEKVLISDHKVIEECKVYGNPASKMKWFLVCQ